MSLIKRVLPLFHNVNTCLRIFGDCTELVIPLLDGSRLLSIVGLVDR